MRTGSSPAYLIIDMRSPVKGATRDVGSTLTFFLVLTLYEEALAPPKEFKATT